MSVDPCVDLVPLFPLPNVVLFPRAVLPLHIFELRYRQMTADVLEGERQIAMALLKPGWEKTYHGSPAIEPVVCVGAILTHERLPDGRYNLLLQGQYRARIVQEQKTGMYRTARLERIFEPPVMEIDFDEPRRRMRELFSQPAITEIGVGQQFLKLLGTPLTTPEIADLAAFTFLEDIQAKQALLVEPDPSIRVQRVLQLLEHLKPIVITQKQRDNAELN